MIVALATMIVGILGAVAQAEMKRILSFTLVSHAGYMIFGLAIGTPAAIGATIYYTVHHSSVRTPLFRAHETANPQDRRRARATFDEPHREEQGRLHDDVVNGVVDRRADDPVPRGGAHRTSS